MPLKNLLRLLLFKRFFNLFGASREIEQHTFERIESQSADENGHRQFIALFNRANGHAMIPAYLQRALKHRNGVVKRRFRHLTRARGHTDQIVVLVNPRQRVEWPATDAEQNTRILSDLNAQPRAVQARGSSR